MELLIDLFLFSSVRTAISNNHINISVFRRKKQCWEILKIYVFKILFKILAMCSVVFSIFIL